MAKISNTSGASNIWLGSKSNSQQSILYVPAALTANKPGLLFLESINDGATASDLGGVYLWADDANAFHVSATYPTDQDDASTIIAAASTDATLLSIAALGTAADKMLYTTDVDTWAELAVTSYGRSILDDTSEAVFKATVNLEIGTDVLAYDAGLSNLAGIAMVADRMYYTSANDTHVATPITATGRSILDDASTAAVLTTIGAVAKGANADLTDLTGMTGELKTPTDITMTGALATATTITMSGALATPTTITASSYITTSGDIRITSDSNRLELGADATDSYIVYNGADLVLYDIGTGAYTLAELAASGGLSPIVAGDMTISDGSLTITDGDNAATVAITNDAITSSDMVTLSAAGVLTGAMLHIDADAMTTGQFIECDDGGVQFAVKLGGEIEITGVTDADMLTITAGNVLISDGTLNMTDADDNTLITLVNNAVTTTDLIHITADGITTGAAIVIDIDGDVSAGGNYIECYKGNGDVFEVGAAGAVTIAGSAHGTDAITLTAGDITLTDGFIEAGASASGTGHGHTFATADDGTNDTALVTMSNSVAGFDMPLLQLTGASTGDVNTMQITNAGTGFGISITDSLATGEGLEILMAANSTQNGLLIDANTGSYLGATTKGMLKIHQTGTLAAADASAIFVDFDGQPAASGLGYALLIDDDAAAVATTYAVAINSLANIPLHLESQGATKACLWIETGAQTEAAVVLDGATNDWGGKDDAGLLDITSDANLAHAGSTLLRIATSNVIDAAEGGLARFVDTAAVSGGTLSYAVEIYSNANHALHVSKGKSVFEDAIIFEGNAYDITDLAAPPTNANCITMFGAAGNQGAMYLYDDNDAGTSVYIIIDDGGDYHYITSVQAG